MVVGFFLLRSMSILSLFGYSYDRTQTAQGVYSILGNVALQVFWVHTKVGIRRIRSLASWDSHLAAFLEADQLSFAVTISVTVSLALLTWFVWFAIDFLAHEFHGWFVAFAQRLDFGGGIAAAALTTDTESSGFVITVIKAYDDDDDDNKKKDELHAIFNPIPTQIVHIKNPSVENSRLVPTPLQPKMGSSAFRLPR